jgi:hypothetical protein
MGDMCHCLQIDISGNTKCPGPQHRSKCNFIGFCASLALWAFPLRQRARKSFLAGSIILLAAYETWWISQRELIQHIWMHVAYFLFSCLVYFCALGALVLGVELVDRLLASIRRRPPTGLDV